MKRTNILLDDQARKDAQWVAKEYGLRSVSAAVRFALREIAKRAKRPPMTHNLTQNDTTDPPSTAS